ncbi:isochorismatase family protein [Desulfosediminicola flagellatus]|uniref:isochorismatase family protein n=1 Tax=Desulfosediminicola flagellatus TaxID=2569541 RepID=UPI0010ACC342|nr:isochorismatase family protein [Desulfosediminicola flagellatus]
MDNARLLKPESCYLHVIDVQQSLMRQVHEADQVTATTALMMKCAAILRLPIVANTQYKKGLGLYVPEIEVLVEGIPRPDKVEFNGLANEETCNVVDALSKSIDTVILVGVETHICIYQTAMGALARGLTPWIVSDGVSSRRKENHEAGLARLRDVGAKVGPAEMLVYELLEKAGTEQFKQVLPLIVEQN